MTLATQLSDRELRRIAAERQVERFGHVIDPVLETPAPAIALGPDSPLHQLKPPRAPRQDLEHEEQVALFAWAETAKVHRPLLERLFAVPNFSGRMGKRTARHGARLKAEGRKPGVPDVWLPVARGGYHGLVIEMKAGRNEPTHEQRHWLHYLDDAGWLTRVCYSAHEAQHEIELYLDGRLTTTEPAPC